MLSLAPLIEAETGKLLDLRPLAKALRLSNRKLAARRLKTLLPSKVQTLMGVSTMLEISQPRRAELRRRMKFRYANARLK